MPLQTGKNVAVVYAPETVFNTPAAVGSGRRFRPNPSPGLDITRAVIRANEVRADLKDTMGRLGARDVKGTYMADLSVGTFDPLFEAVTRGTWTAAVAATSVGQSGITTTANTIVLAGAGSWITSGVRVGDVIRSTSFPDAGNNNRNLRVTGVTAGVLTVAETLIVNAVVAPSWTITIAKTVIQPLVPVRRSFTFEEVQRDIGVSEQVTGARVSMMKIAGQPNGMCTVDFGFVAANLFALTGANSPYFTGTPVLTSSPGLILADATLRYAGADVLTLTSFDMTLDLRASVQPTIGSTITPDVYDNSATLAGSISGTRVDLSNMTRFLGETELEFHALLVEPMVEPKNFISIFIPRVKLTGAATPQGNDGAMIETLPFITGDKEVVAGYDDTMIKISTSAP